MKRTVVFSCFLILAFACTRDVALDLPLVPSRLVLNVAVSPEEDLTATLSRSWFILDSIPEDAVSDGKISVYVNGGFRGRMSSDTTSRLPGKYVLPGCCIRKGESFRLEVEAAGFEPVSGETRMPDPVNLLTVDTARFILSDNYGDEIPRMRVYVRFQDNSGQRNYYRLIIEKWVETQYGDSIERSNSLYSSSSAKREFLNIRYEDIVFHTNTTNPVFEQLDGATSQGTFSDAMFDGRAYTLLAYFWPIDTSFRHDSVSVTVHYDVRLLAISEAYYRYMTVIRNFSLYLGDAFLGGQVDPSDTYTNVENGFGIVAAYQQDHRRITMPFVSE